MFLPITILLAPIPVFAATCDSGFKSYIEGTPKLTKRGSGTARYLLFRIYDAALYTSEQDSAATQMSTQPLCLEICYRRSLDADIIVTAAEKVLVEQNDPLELGQIQPQIDQLHRAYKSVSEGDRYRLCRDEKSQLTLTLNGEELTTVTGESFSQRYLNIWLGERPMSRSLRASLLAESSPNSQQDTY